ncbi:DsrE family protein [uncultured Amphritea sp.]|uniref:DsrE family protein n=1 Tax=uncultured Amphritea sp. TaxID=981605 RepID=UPI00262F07F7|nr:DsrE family protein [uncultured Amphritea sp.]
MKKLLMPAIIAAALISPIAPAAAGSTDNVVITLTSAEQQTRGMAMVLANAMQAKGAHVSVLLCDSAGDMALKEHQSTPLKPKNVTPEQLLQKLMSGGARVDVCALYLPNKGVGMEALKEGVGSAKPATMAEALMAEGTRVFNF